MNCMSCHLPGIMLGFMTCVFAGAKGNIKAAVKALKAVYAGDTDS